MTFQNNDALVRNMNSDFISRNDRIARLGMTINTFQNIPGLVAFYPMSGVQRSTGDARDFGMGGLDLTYNGNPTYNIYNDLVPYIDFDGTGDFLSRADETDLDILGTETIYAAATRGLTMGGWFWFDTLTGAGSDRIMGKRGGTPGSGFAYFLQFDSGAGVLQMYVSVDGSTLISVPVAFSTTGSWFFIIGRFDPSTELAIFVNGTKTINTTSIPASIVNITGAFQIGATQSIEPMDGRASNCFLSANFLTDAYLNAIFQQSRILFGV